MQFFQFCSATKTCPNDKSIHELVCLQFWRPYVTWFGADAPSTYDSEVYYVILVTYVRVLPWPNNKRRQCLKPKTWVQLCSWPWLLSNQDYIDTSILIFFFDYDKIAFNIFCFTLGMIRGYWISFSVKTPLKSLS